MQFFPLENTVGQFLQSASPSGSIGGILSHQASNVPDFNNILSTMSSWKDAGDESFKLIGHKREEMLKREDLSAMSNMLTGFKSRFSSTGLKQDQVLSREDIAALSGFLRRLGLSDQDIDNLSESVADGLSWGGLLKQLQPNMSMSDEMQAQLKDVMSRLGFDENETTEMLTALKAGRFSTVWSSIKSLLDQSAAGESSMLESSDLVLLTKIFSLSDKAKAELGAMLQGLGEGELNNDQVRNFLSVLKNGVAESQKAMDEMRDKMKELTAQSVTASTAAMARQTSEADAARQKELADARKTIPGLREVGDPLKPGASKAGEHGKSDHNALNNGNDAENKDLAGRNELAAKTSVSARDAAQFQATPVQSVLETAQANQNPLSAPKENFSSQSIFRQVETALLKDTGNGLHRITLELNPATLGKVLLTIHVIEGEVRATIRVQDPETTKFLNDQAHLLRQSLEQQGLKVEKLDIQTQLQEENRNNFSWHGSEEHNEARQQHRKMKKDFADRILMENGETLASNMQPDGIQAKISAEGLVDIIA